MANQKLISRTVTKDLNIDLTEDRVTKGSLKYSLNVNGLKIEFADLREANNIMACFV